MTEPVCSVLNIHDLAERSLVNGPGARAVVWVQGCLLHCNGCFNLGTWPMEGGRHITIPEIMACFDPANIQGITLSGGEPFLQASAAAELLKLCHLKGIDTMVYTGFTFSELKQSELPGSRELLLQTDLLIDGPYIRTIAPDGEWSGSGNQKLRCLSSQGMAMKRVRKTGITEKEYIISPEGHLTLTGIL